MAHKHSVGPSTEMLSSQVGRLLATAFQRGVPAIQATELHTNSPSVASAIHPAHPTGRPPASTNPASGRRAVTAASSCWPCSNFAASDGVARKTPSFLVIGEMGVGKTGLINILVNEEPNLTYMPTVEMEHHEPPRQHYRLTEVPGHFSESERLQAQPFSDHDLVIFVFRIDKKLTRLHYRKFWTSALPMPVVVVGVSTDKTDENTGESLQYTLACGTWCNYFPVVMNDPRSFRKLSSFLDSQAFRLSRQHRK
ncbi:hypothetical protein PCL_09589 [Purpureocillium lilacinum]|uniref:Uncharacterized protein n=1 Tax=Purpureocillium lilacinum TaxID=33203 RepID=A0A2U3DQI1_PURLI|nr:hypothetical protein PCL_09589 [Purpureocillium lilacinum]